MSRSECAVATFKNGFNCAQSVVFSFAESLNISKDSALRISNGFGAGMGRKQEVCGAITGGILVLSHLYGRGEHDEAQKQDETYAKVRELINRFEHTYTTINCKQLLGGCDLSTTEGQAHFKANHLKEKCTAYVEHTVKILEEMIS